MTGRHTAIKGSFRTWPDKTFTLTITILSEPSDWFETGFGLNQNVPGFPEEAISARYRQFRKELPEICEGLKIQVEELTFADYSQVVIEWLRKESANDRASKKLDNLR